MTIVSIDGDGLAVLGDNVSMFDGRKVALVGVREDSGGDAFRCERCEHLLLERVTMTTEGRATREIVNINQSSDIEILDSDLGGADDNVIDLVAI